MEEHIRALLAESAALARSPLERPTARIPARGRVSSRELVEGLGLSLDRQQREFLAALLAAIPASNDAPPRLPTPPPSIHEGGFRIYPIPREPAFGDCSAGNPPCSTHYLGVPGHFGALAYLRGVRGRPKRLLIALHGSDPPSWRRHPAAAIYQRVAEVAERMWGDDYAIVAPVFQRTNFKPYTLSAPWIWYWAGGWGYGFRPARFNPCHFLIESAGLSCAEADASARSVDLAIGGYTGRPSSFEVLDELIRHELGRLPALEYVCLLGHSHGGQAVQRYALLDRGIADEVQRATKRPLRYVAMNAGAYAYLSPRRWITPPRRSIACRPALPDNPEAAQWTIPTGCEGYDDWGLGLSAAAQAEAAGVPLEAARQHAIARYGLDAAASLRAALAYNFAHKDVHILQSARDHVRGPGSTCGPFQQGCSRLDRMRLFRDSLRVDLPDALHEAMVRIVRNCRVIEATQPHSSASMLQDPKVREVIFGPG